MFAAMSHVRFSLTTFAHLVLSLSFAHYFQSPWLVSLSSSSLALWMRAHRTLDIRLFWMHNQRRKQNVSMIISIIMASNAKIVCDNTE